MQFIGEIGPWPTRTRIVDIGSAQSVSIHAKERVNGGRSAFFQTGMNDNSHDRFYSLPVRNCRTRIRGRRTEFVFGLIPDWPASHSVHLLSCELRFVQGDSAVCLAGAPGTALPGLIVDEIAPVPVAREWRWSPARMLPLRRCNGVVPLPLAVIPEDCRFGQQAACRPCLGPVPASQGIRTSWQTHEMVSIMARFQKRC